MSSHPSRREFLQSSTLATAAFISSKAGGAPVVPVIIDTHLHCFAGVDDARFPYHPRAPYRPPAAATPERLLKCMDGAGVNHAIVVQPEPYQDDHRYLEHCLQVGKGRLKGTCLVFADQPVSVNQLDGLAKRGDIVAARIHAYAPDRLPPFGKPELRALWKKASDLGMAVIEREQDRGDAPRLRIQQRAILVQQSADALRIALLNRLNQCVVLHRDIVAPVAARRFSIPAILPRGETVRVGIVLDHTYG